MHKYAVTLKAPDSDQKRVVSLRAGDEQHARELALGLEDEAVAYDFNQDFAGVQETEDGVIVRAGLRSGDAERILDTYRFDDNGRVVFTGQGRGSRRERAKLALHHQAAPYVVQGIQRVQLDQERVARLVAELAALKHQPAEWDALLEQLRDEGLPINAVTAQMYGVPVKNQYDGTAVVDWDTDTIKIALLSSYTADYDTHDFYNDASSTETSGTGYTAGGATLGSKTATYDTASDQARLDAADPSWTTSTISATDAVVYKSTGTASTSPLIVGIDFGATVASTAGTYSVAFDSTGVAVIDVT